VLLWGNPYVHNIFLLFVWVGVFLFWFVFGVAGWLCWLPQVVFLDRSDVP
jgi:hypothetical protein